MWESDVQVVGRQYDWRDRFERSTPYDPPRFGPLIEPSG